MPSKLSVLALEEYAKHKIPKHIFKYFAYGADKETTLKENIAAFERWKVLPKYLQEIDSLKWNTSTTILGETVALPICASPSGFHKLVHKMGELETVKGCFAAGTCMVVSAYSSYSYQDIANAAPKGLRWLQMYIFKDRELTKDFIRRAEEFGYKALVITVDSGSLGYKLDSESIPIPQEASAANFAQNDADSLDLIEPCFGGSDIEWVRSITNLPIVLKGIISTSDAQVAVKYGVDGIIVSNKGGRKLDVLPSTIDVLPGIVEEVNNRAEIYIDGGIRSGADVFKALALGARAVFLGRPVIWGLIYDGSQGVQSVFESMNEELGILMANTGCKRISDIDKSLLMRHPWCSCKL